MDDTFKKQKMGFSRHLAIILLSLPFLALYSFASQTYAMGANEEFQASLTDNYQQSSKLSDFIKNFIGYFYQENQTESLSNPVTYVGEKDSINDLCKKDSSLAFTDIQNNENKDYIITLYNKGIVIGSSNKFLPNDHLRFYCMIKILVDSYRSKMGYDLKTELGLSQRNYFPNIGKDIDKISLKYLNTSYELGLLEGIDDIDLSSKAYFQKNSSKYLVKKLFENLSKQFPLLVDISIISQIGNGQDFMTRGEYTKYVVEFFEFKLENTSEQCNDSRKEKFSDFMNHDYESDIQVLADLGITNSNGYSFYPNNNLRYYEFIIMLTRTILYKENQNLDIYVLDHIASFEDIDPNASYAKYFEYAYHNGFLDYGFDTKTGKPSVHPNKFITIDEVNNIFSKLVGKPISFQAKSTDGLVTRGEFADMLVDGFGLENKKTLNTNTYNTDYHKQSSSILNDIGSWLKSAKLLSKL